MVRVAWIVVAGVAGAVAAVLLVWGPTVQVDGRDASCAGIIATAEGGGLYDNPRVARACDRVQDRWTAYAVGAAVVCLVAGTGALFRQSKDRGGNRDTQVSIDNR